MGISRCRDEAWKSGLAEPGERRVFFSHGHTCQAPHGRYLALQRASGPQRHNLNG